MVDGGEDRCARLPLFCFPYAGGGASIYRSWEASSNGAIAVCPVQLPGRENRLQEAPFIDLRALSRSLADNLAERLNQPFAFFGHSMGAAIAFELARELRRREKPLPARLFLSARGAPQLAPRNLPIHGLPDCDFLERLRQYGGTPQAFFANPELVELLLPTIRADFAMLETHEYVSEPPLQCPISVFGGDRDQTVSQASLSAWQEQTAKTLTTRVFSGGHFFLQTAGSEMLAHIRADLDGSLDPT